MDKRVITFCAVGGMTIGALIPMVLGWDPTGFGIPSLLGGLVGGILGVWVGAKIPS